ncbi:MAG: hypothetical protein ACRDGN_11485 [bacterium]
MNVRGVVWAGLIASMVMGMIEMIYEAVGGAGFWSPLVFIGATLIRDLQALQGPVPFHAAAVVLGLMGHMMSSVIFALIFAGLVSRMTLARGALVGTGIAYGVVVFAIMWYLVLPAVDPVMLGLNKVVFVLAHMMWGAVLGLVVPQSLGAPVGLQSA